jgi:hypothetical protein
MDGELLLTWMGWTRHVTSERTGEVPGRSPNRAGSVTLADHQPSSTSSNAISRSSAASGTERARLAQPGHFTGALGAARDHPPRAADHHDP